MQWTKLKLRLRFNLSLIGREQSTTSAGKQAREEKTMFHFCIQASPMSTPRIKSWNSNDSPLNRLTENPHHHSNILEVHSFFLMSVWCASTRLSLRSGWGVALWIKDICMRVQEKKLHSASAQSHIEDLRMNVWCGDIHTRSHESGNHSAEPVYNTFPILHCASLLSNLLLSLRSATSS